MEKKDKNEEKKIPDASRLHIMELVQYMARPLKELEVKFAESCKEFKDAELCQHKFNDRVESAFVSLKEDSAKLEEEIQRAKLEAVKAMNEASQYKHLPERLNAVEADMSGVLEEAKIGELVRQEQKANSRELDRLMKSLSGCYQELEKVKAQFADVERQHKNKLKDHELALKDMRRSMDDFVQQMLNDRADLGKVLAEASEDVKSRQKHMLQQIESNDRALRAELESLKRAVHAELQQVFSDAKRVANDANDKLSRYDSEIDAMSVIKKEVKILDRRMDKVVAVVKQMKAHFEFED